MGHSKTLAERLEEAKAEVARLEREAASASCAEIGHDWVFFGGKTCSCHENSSCYIPVYECSRCGDCDYGDNEEAKNIYINCVEVESDEL